MSDQKKLGIFADPVEMFKHLIADCEPAVILDIKEGCLSVEWHDERGRSVAGATLALAPSLAEHTATVWDPDGDEIGSISGLDVLRLLSGSLKMEVQR